MELFIAAMMLLNSIWPWYQLEGVTYELKPMPNYTTYGGGAYADCETNTIRLDIPRLTYWGNKIFPDDEEGPLWNTAHALAHELQHIWDGCLGEKSAITRGVLFLSEVLPHGRKYDKVIDMYWRMQRGYY